MRYIAFILLIIAIAISGCGYKVVKDPNAEYKTIPELATTIKALTEIEAKGVAESYLQGKYPARSPSYEVYNAILRPSGSWQMYVKSGDSRGIVCIDAKGDASGLYDMNADCSL